MERRWSEPGAEYLDRPICDAVGGVVQHLPDYLPADAGVSAALDLDYGRDNGLVEEEVVDRPSTAPVLLGGERHLARDQQPAARLCDLYLISSQQVRVFGEKSLQQVL